MTVGCRHFGDILPATCGPGSSVGIATGYGLDGPGSNPDGGEIFRTCPHRPWAPSSLLYNGYRVFPGGKERPGRDADPSPLLVPWSWKGRAIPLFPLWAVRPVQSLSACTRVHFTFTFTLPTGHAVFLDCLAPEVWDTKGPETSAKNCQLSPSNIPKDRRRRVSKYLFW